MRLRREHGITAALGVSVVLAIIDLLWSYTLHYKLAQPDFYVYYTVGRRSTTRRSSFHRSRPLLANHCRTSTRQNLPGW